MRRLHLPERNRSRRTRSAGQVVIRPAYPDDADALDRLAGLDSRNVPSGPMLLAEVGDDVRAAVSLSDGTVLADPFQPTAELIPLLRARAADFSP